MIYWASKSIQMSFIRESPWNIPENKDIVCCRITVCSGCISRAFNIAVWWLRLRTPIHRLASVPCSDSIWFKLLLLMFTQSVRMLALFFSGIIPQAVAYSVQPPPTTTHVEQCGKMEPKYPQGGHCQSVLRPHGVFNAPLYF